MAKKAIKIHEVYEGIIDKVPEGWEEIVAKDPMELTEGELYKIIKAVAAKFKPSVANDENKIKGYAKGTLFKEDFPEIYKDGIITFVAVATDNWDPSKEFFKPKKVIYPYFPSR